jgi:hypothetical protein
MSQALSFLQHVRGYITRTQQSDAFHATPAAEAYLISTMEEKVDVLVVTAFLKVYELEIAEILKRLW